MIGCRQEPLGDFLMLMRGRRRLVLESDGKQHYADDDGRASPRRYAEMVAAARDLHLAGYEVVRFGGAELQSQEQSLPMLRSYFTRLFTAHGLCHANSPCSVLTWPFSDAVRPLGGTR